MVVKRGKTRPEALEKAPAGRNSDGYVLRLYVAGLTPWSTRAIANVRKLCDEHLAGRYELEVIDLYQQPGLASVEQIIAVPTLIKTMPLPIRRLIGDMSNTEKVLTGMDLKPRTS